eukprot:TRINITY_DN4147_c0_g3_i2.p1 TRINITY_DN4147_c0_g3~~TRINITY_DN4147_c0_g3_i2.p1  ORF type:complete len:484 (-),score=37.86 TRINITY_DN4147_c0_g3_i2:391-1782(-)
MRSLFYIVELFGALCILTVGVQTAVDCDRWQQSPLSHIAQIVSIKAGGYHFCGGMALDKSWIVSSNSCVQNMIQWRRNTQQNQQQMQHQSGSSISGIDIEVDSVATDNCDTSRDISAGNFQSAVEFVIQYPEYQSKDIPNLFEPNVSNSVYINDLVLLKLKSPMNWLEDYSLRISADQVPNNLQNRLELLTWRLRKPNGSDEQPVFSVLNDRSQYGLKCEKMITMFQNSEYLNEDQKNYVNQFTDDLFCMDYTVPVIKNRRCRTYHAGDPVIMSEDEGYRLLGMLTEGFVHPHIRDGLEPNDEDNRHYCYSQEDVGDPSATPTQAGLVMFFAFNQMQMQWISEVINNDNTEYAMKQESGSRSKENTLVIVIVIVVGVTAAVVVASYLLYRFRRNKIVEAVLPKRCSPPNRRRYSNLEESATSTNSSSLVKELQLKGCDSGETWSNGSEVQAGPLEKTQSSSAV